MKAIIGVLALVLLVGIGGCKSGVTEQDTANMRKEFSEDNYKENMYKAGKGAEYEAEKARQQQYGQDGQ